MKKKMTKTYITKEEITKQIKVLKGEYDYNEPRFAQLPNGDYLEINTYTIVKAKDVVEDLTKPITNCKDWELEPNIETDYLILK